MEVDTTTLKEKKVNPVITFLQRIPVIYFVMLLIFVVIGIVQPNFYNSRPFFGFLKRAAPLIVVSIGQMFVIISGEFDLSVGSLITVCAAVAAKVIFNDPTKVWEAFAWILGIALVVGLINGLVTTNKGTFIHNYPGDDVNIDRSYINIYARRTAGWCDG